MKRHEKLQDLSREHYGALKLALQAKRAAMSGEPAQIGASAAACVAAFAAELEPHFQVEENTLLPLLAASGESELVQRVEQDHRELRLFAAQLRQPEASALLAFAELLTTHVRFEEREMFEAAEALYANIGNA